MHADAVARHHTDPFLFASTTHSSHVGHLPTAIAIFAFDQTAPCSQTGTNVILNLKIVKFTKNSHLLGSGRLEPVDVLARLRIERLEPQVLLDTALFRLAAREHALLQDVLLVWLVKCQVEAEVAGDKAEHLLHC